jgi:hypothetical protein
LVTKQLKKMVVRGDHIVTDTGPPWSVLWDTTSRPEGQWSTAEAKNEAAALERAAHFRKLGFAVHAINDPSGVMVMDAAAIAARLSHSVNEQPVGPAERARPSAEQSCRSLLRRLVQHYNAMPGRMLTTESVRTLLPVQTMSGSEFERALSFAKEHGWLNIAEGALTLTQAGYEVAIA